jgi:hypothetical protein
MNMKQADKKGVMNYAPTQIEFTCRGAIHRARLESRDRLKP